MIQDFFNKIYSRLCNNKIVPFYVMRGIRFTIRSIANRAIRMVFSNTHPICCDQNSKVIVSLTSFPKRIGNIWLTINSLLRQSYRPRTILLWLSREQFPSLSILPESVVNLQRYGLKICFVDDDLRSHKKYYYAFQEFQGELIFLADDDIIYPSDMIEKSLQIYEKCQEKTVVGRYGYQMTYEKNGTLKPYSEWIHCAENKNFFSNFNLFFGSGGGTLVNPKDFYSDVCNKELIMKLTPLADDVWLNAHARLGGCKIVLLYQGLFLPIIYRENETLASKNIGTEALNDIQIQNVINYYLQTLNRNPFEFIEGENE